jgi:hypothetical protein
VAAQDLQINETREEYAGQQDGTNEYGCPFIEGQNATNAVQGLDDLLASMGFSSLDEMMAAATNL